MTDFVLPRVLSRLLAVAAIFLHANVAFGQPPGDSGGMAWQLAALFTANWVLVAVGVAMMSRPSKRADKPKKNIETEQTV